MKKITRCLILVLIAFVAVSSEAISVQAQELCSGKGTERKEFTIRNDLDFDIEIKWVKKDCSEAQGLTVGAKREIAVASFVNHVFRVYENLTDRVLTHVHFDSDKTVYPIEGFSKSQHDPTKKLCSKTGDPRLFFLRNATSKPITVKFVDTDCTERPGPTIAPGKQQGGQTFVNNVFRAYEAESGKFLTQIVVRPTIRNYVVGGARNRDPAQGFVDTVNNIRSASNLPPIDLDETLNKTCQWFADFMAKEDQKKAGHLVKDFRRDRMFRNMNTPKQRLIHFGWKKNRASDTAETTAIQRVEDAELIGAYFTLEWTASTTHDKPFFDRHRTKFKKVGFGAAPSPSDLDMYYGCAIFAND